MIFKNLSKNLDIKKIQNSNPYHLLRVISALHVLPPDLSVEIFSFSEIRRFLWLFQNFSENFDSKSFTKFEIINTIVGCCVKVLSGGRTGYDEMDDIAPSPLLVLL